MTMALANAPKTTGTRLVSLADVRRAAGIIAKVVVRTPLLPLRGEDRPDVFLKCENLQRTGAFKIRGAYHKIAKLPRECPGVVAYSSGNHAQAVALAAKLRGLPACIVMFDASVPLKVEATRAHGAEIVFGGGTSEAIRARAEGVAQERGWTIVAPFDDPDVIAGQGTVGLEILEDLPETAAIVIPVGGGGLLAGVAAAAKGVNPRVRIYAVEPEGAASMRLALHEGRPVALPKTDTVADGLMALRVGERTLAHAQALMDDLVLVSDAEILETARHLLRREKLVVEPSGAAALAAIRTGRLALPPGPVVAVLSGGNADLKRLNGK